MDGLAQVPLVAPAPPSSGGATPPVKPLPKVSGSGAILTGGYNTHKIFIGSLPETATLADLEDCFGQLGQCTCSIKRGFGFVEYTDAACAAEAVAKYHEGHFLGAQIKVELSHARQAQPKPVHEDGKPLQRNPPGSDRPSDSRKPMHINGPPPAEKLPGSKLRGAPRSPLDHGSPLGPDYRRDAPPLRFSAGPPAPLPRDMPYDRYRDDLRDSRGPPPPPPAPAPYRDPRYESREFFDRSGYGPPPSSREYDYRPPSGYGPPPLDPRDRPPYDPYFDAPPARDAPSWGPPPSRGGPPFPHSGAGAGYSNGAPARPYDPYPSDRYDSYNSRPPLASLHYDPPGRPSYAPYPSDPYGLPPAPLPSRDDRRYDPYPPRSPPRHDRRASDNFGGRSPYRGGPPPDRRRSLSPRRRDDGGYRGGDYGPPSGGYQFQSQYGGRSPPRFPQNDDHGRR